MESRLKWLKKDQKKNDEKAEKPQIGQEFCQEMGDLRWGGNYSGYCSPCC